MRALQTICASTSISPPHRAEPNSKYRSSLPVGVQERSVTAPASVESLGEDEDRETSR